MYALLVRLKIAPPSAPPITILFIARPICVLYENWLFYTYPVTLLLCASALFPPVLVASSFADALTFFSLLALTVLTGGRSIRCGCSCSSAALLIVERGQRRLLARAAAARCGGGAHADQEPGPVREPVGGGSIQSVNIAG